MREQALFLGLQSEVFGIYHNPASENAQDLAFVFLNSGLLHRTGPFRLYTELARKLGDIGEAPFGLGL